MDAQGRGYYHKRRCVDCRFYNPDTGCDDLGICMLHPPTGMIDGDGNLKSGQPGTRENWFCGEWVENNES